MRDENWDIERLLGALGTDIGTFTIVDIEPAGDEPRARFCQIRSSTYEAVYEVPEQETTIGVYHDREHQLIGIFIRRWVDVPAAMFEWAVNQINEYKVGQAMIFSQPGILLVQPDMDEEDDADSAVAAEEREVTDSGEPYLILECGYHLSAVQHVVDPSDHVALMAAMLRDSMNRLFVESHAMANELGNDYEEYCRASRH